MKIEHNIDLAPYNSFGVSVHADRFAEVSGADDLAALFALPEVKAAPWLTVSGGNNILFTQDYHGTIVHPVSRELHILDENSDSVRVRVGAGVEWDDFVEWCVERDLWGVENLSLIPGKVGASPVQNIGAYGAEAANTISAVEMFCTDSGKQLTLTRDYCSFGYRESIFKHELKGKVVVTAVVFELSRKPQPKLDYGDVRARVESLGGVSLHNIRQAVIEIRRAKLPDPKVTGNAGSFFKNPVVDTAVADTLREAYPDVPVYQTSDEGKVKIAAGWLIDKCGWKGRALGRAAVHSRQALVLVNNGGATGADVIALSNAIRKDVADKFGINIEPEVNII